VEKDLAYVFDKLMCLDKYLDDSGESTPSRRGSVKSIIALINRLELHLLSQQDQDQDEDADNTPAVRVEVNFGTDWHLYMNAGQKDMALVYLNSAMQTSFENHGPGKKSGSHEFGACEVECFVMSSEKDHTAVRVRFSNECANLRHKIAFATKIKEGLRIYKPQGFESKFFTEVCQAEKTADWTWIKSTAGKRLYTGELR